MRGALVVAAMALALAAASADALGRSSSDGVQVDISRARGVQSETTIAVDPTNDRILLAGSNSVAGLRTRAYGSTDGGATWTTSTLPLPPPSRESSDPVVGIDTLGRQYAGFVGIGPSADENGAVHLYVASRPNASSVWTTASSPIPTRAGALDDKPALAVDSSPQSPHLNRVYVAWSLINPHAPSGASIVLAYSDDGARSWSQPTQVGDRLRSFDSYPSLAVARDGTVYVTWWNALGAGVAIDASRDGGVTFGRDVLVDPLRERSSCQPPGVRIPAQPTNCVRPNPIVSVDNSTGPFAGRVYVSYGDAGQRGAQDVYLAALDPGLHELFARRLVNRPDGRVRVDQFWPASAVDPSTGILWACYYDTTGDSRRRRAYYTCTRSKDGGAHWAAQVHAASLPSNETAKGADTKRHGFHREYGDYEGLAVANGVAHPVWTDTRRLSTLQEEVYTTTLSEASFPTPRLSRPARRVAG